MNRENLEIKTLIVAFPISMIAINNYTFTVKDLQNSNKIDSIQYCEDQYKIIVYQDGSHKLFDSLKDIENIEEYIDLWWKEYSTKIYRSKPYFKKSNPNEVKYFLIGEDVSDEYTFIEPPKNSTGWVEYKKFHDNKWVDDDDAILESKKQDVLKKIKNKITELSEIRDAYRDRKELGFKQTITQNEYFTILETIDKLRRLPKKPVKWWTSDEYSKIWR